MRIKEMTVSLSGAIPIASYENLKPGFSVTMEISPDDDHKTIMTDMRKYLRKVFELESNSAKADMLGKLYDGLRFYEKDGIKYPSVTSILFYGKDFHVAEHELAQYAARGTIVGEMVEQFLSTGKWIDPEQTESLLDDVAVLLGGTLKMHWNQCAHKQFIAKFGAKIKAESVQGVVYNEEYLYAGTYDILGLYDTVRSLMDVKCGAFDMRQLAAYAMCLEGVEQLVVLPAGPTDNKCGYKKPVVCTSIQQEFDGFLKARAKFRQRFGL